MARKSNNSGRIYLPYLTRLIRVCREKNYQVKTIGLAGRKKEFPIVKVSISAGRVKRTICFSAGIHGDEICGPEAVLAFLKKYKPVPGLRIIILPVGNPYGYNRGGYRNLANINLNRHFFDTKLSGENKILYNAVKNENLFFFASFHEDDEMRDTYMYGYSKNVEDKFLYQNILRRSSAVSPVTNTAKIYRRKAEAGVIFRSKIINGGFEDRMFTDGVPYSICLEPSNSKPLKARIGVILSVMAGIIEFSQGTSPRNRELKCNFFGSRAVFVNGLTHGPL